MSKNKKTSNSYAECFASVQAPDALRKDILMKKNFAKASASRTKKSAMLLAAAAAIVFAGADGLTYAATGTGIIETIYVSVNGQKKAIQMEKVEDPNGASYYMGHYEDADTSVTINMEDEKAMEDVQFTIDEDENGPAISVEEDPGAADQEKLVTSTLITETDETK